MGHGALGRQCRGRVTRLVPLWGSKLQVASPTGQASAIMGKADFHGWAWVFP
ncbi:hypothetical protein FDUTEX481_10069 [Tolypothrix sp. PCC 7601]|nr:hypothetical protein FDUTEX481_10069 [Tolypothrix sp. PCC 7601]